MNFQTRSRFLKGFMKNARRNLTAFCSLVVFCSSLLAAQPASGNDLLLPSPALERTGPVQVIYKTGWPSTGKGELSIKWTDVYGRMIEDRNLPFVLTDEAQVGFQLDLRRAVAMENELTVHFSFVGKNKKGEKDDREEDAKISFVAKPPQHTWWDYATIMWQSHNADQYATLKNPRHQCGDAPRQACRLA